MRRDPQIVVADHLALELQGGTDGAIELARARRQFQHREQTRQLSELSRRLLAQPALLHPIEKLAVGYDRDHRLARSQSLEPCQNPRRPPLPDVNASVGIQQEARIHLEAVPLLRGSVASAARQEVVRQIGENFAGPRQSLSLLAQDDLVRSAEHTSELQSRFGI